VTSKSEIAAIQEKILEFRTSRDKPAFVRYFLENEQRLELLMGHLWSLAPYPYKEYASWMFIHICKANPSQQQKHYAKLVDVLFETKDQSVLRNVCCALQHFTIESHRESAFIDQLIAFLQDSSNKVALHVYSIYILGKFCQKYPELTAEITEIIDHNARQKSAAYGSARRNFAKMTRVK